MKRACGAALLAALAVVLTGCSVVLERSYSAVQPHASQYWEDATASVLRAEDYQSLVNGLLVLVSDQTDTALVRLYGCANRTEAVQEMDRASAEVTLQDPMGAYVVDYVTYEADEGVNCYEFTVRIVYRKTPEQVRAITNATTAGAVPDLLRAAVGEGRTELAVRIGYMDRTPGEITASAASVMEENGLTEEAWSVTYYPNTGNEGDTRIVEFIWQPPQAADGGSAAGGE